MISPELQHALSNLRSAVKGNPFDAVGAAQALHRLAVLAPPHVAPMVHKAGQAIAQSLEYPGSRYDGVARCTLQQLVIAIERSNLRVVK